MLLIVSYSIGALMLLFMFPVVRARHLLEWCQMDVAASELRNSVNKLGVAYLGKTRSDVLIRNFHLSWKPVESARSSARSVRQKNVQSDN